MNIISAILLGAIQGITEFLPISSSAHLVIAQNFIPGFSQPGVLFDVILHAGTLLAVIIYFRKKLLTLNKEQVLLLLIGTIPAVLAGVLFGSVLEESFGNVKAIGVELIISGILCFAIDRAKEIKTSITKTQAVIIGIAQAIAIIPGISRSGATIFASTSMGIKRAKAAEFSFLLSIPAIAGAIIYEAIKYSGNTDINLVNYSAGFVSSLIFGFLSIGILLKMLSSKKLFYFGIYCVVLGITIVLGF